MVFSFSHPPVTNTAAYLLISLPFFSKKATFLLPLDTKNGTFSVYFLSISSIFFCISSTVCRRAPAHSWAWRPQIRQVRNAGRESFQCLLLQRKADIDFHISIFSYPAVNIQNRPFIHLIAGP